MTGFGILGHAENLATVQLEDVDLVIEAMPVLAGTEEEVEGMPAFGLRKGYSAETSGGILTMMKEASARDFVAALAQEHG